MITKGMHEILHTRSAEVQRSVVRPRIPRIFNHDILSCTAEGVKGNHLYSGRILGATEHDDIVQLHPLLKSEWSKIVEHY
ncbi:MAG: hypothetical protein ABW107_19135, partial [Candidatus Thiodiazotropha sp. 6PLUC5]